MDITTEIKGEMNLKIRLGIHFGVDDFDIQVIMYKNLIFLTYIIEPQRNVKDFIDWELR